MINHSFASNVKPVTEVLNNKPRLIFYATEDITKGTEIVYNYNDNRSEIKKLIPWLNRNKSKIIENKILLRTAKVNITKVNITGKKICSK